MIGELNIMVSMKDVESAVSLAERIKKMWDNRKTKKLDKIIDKVDTMDATVKADIRKLEAKFDTKINEVYCKIDENDIKLKRGRILAFADEIRRGLNHSKESYIQILDDVTKYNRYCNMHPEFENERTVIASQVIKDSYANKMNPEGDGFLT